MPCHAAPRPPTAGASRQVEIREEYVEEEWEGAAGGGGAGGGAGGASAVEPAAAALARPTGLDDERAQAGGGASEQERREWARRETEAKARQAARLARQKVAPAPPAVAPATVAFTQRVVERAPAPPAGGGLDALPRSGPGSSMAPPSGGAGGTPESDAPVRISRFKAARMQAEGTGMRELD